MVTQTSWGSGPSWGTSGACAPTWDHQSKFLWVIEGVEFNGHGLHFVPGVQGQVGELQRLCTHVGPPKQVPKGNLLLFTTY